MCTNKELLVAYLYDDVDAAERASMERHLRTCPECRDELDALRGLRTTLSSWTPPQPDLAFRIVDREQEKRQAWRAWWTPAMGLAAAAILVLAVASALAHIEVRYGTDGLTVRTGWDRAAAQQASAVAPIAAAAANGVQKDAAEKLAAQYSAIEQRLRSLEVAARAPAASPVSPVRPVSLAARSDAEVLKRVQDLLAQSESRQRQELALRIAQVIHDVDAQRTADLARIQQGLGRIDAMTTAEVTAHQEMAKYILSSSREQK